MKKNEVIHIIVVAFVLTILTLLLFACQTENVALEEPVIVEETPEPAVPEEGAAPPEVAPEIPEAAPEIMDYFAVRSFLLPNDDINYDFGAFGYLIMRGGDDERNRLICEAFMEEIRSIYSAVYLMRVKQSPKSLMPTYWLLLQKAERYEEEIECSTDCDQNCPLYLEYYDYDRADEMAQKLELFDYGSGPVLVAFKMPYKWYAEYKEIKPEEYLKFDMSDFSNEDVKRAIWSWRKLIAKNPEMWNNGFQIEKIRHACRNFLNKYGSQILAVIK